MFTKLNVRVVVDSKLEDMEGRAQDNRLEEKNWRKMEGEPWEGEVDGGAGERGGVEGVTLKRFFFRQLPACKREALNKYLERRSRGSVFDDWSSGSTAVEKFVGVTSRVGQDCQTFWRGKGRSQ